MSPELWGLTILALLMGLIGLRVPIAIALTIAGMAGYAGVDSLQRAVSMLTSIPGEMIRGYSFSVVPLFVLMGTVAARTGMSRELYDAARALSRPGARASLAGATIGSCALFGAICGSSIATAATMTRVSVPEMQRAGYDDGFAAGAVAAGGTLGILIPPSIILVIYALLAEESVPALFAGAFIPGLLLTVFCIVIAKLLVQLRPHLAPALHSVHSIAERVSAVIKTWKILAIFGLSIGGIYLGWFSPTEAAAVGAASTLAVALATRSLQWRAFVAAIDEAVTTTAMLFFVFLGAVMFSRFIALTQLPSALVDLVGGLHLPGFLVIFILVGFYIMLGCILETVSMILITVPVFLPLVTSLGYDPVWFGILVVVVAEMGLITPPVGMNIFIIRGQMPELPLPALFRGVLPFLGAHIALIVLLVAWPAITSWLPALLL